MITEDALRDLLREAGEAIEPPMPDDEFLRANMPPTEPGRRNKVLLAAAAVLVVLAGIGVIDAVRGSDEPERTDLASGPAVSTTVPFAGGEGYDSGVTVGGGDMSSGASTGASSADVSDTGTGGGGGGPVAVPPSAALPGTPVVETRVVKTGSLDLEVERGSFGDAVDRITSLATGMGGFIAESTTTESDAPSGSITVRVPSESFEQLVTQVRELGAVQQVTVKGTDVTAQFTDLAARLSALTATRDRLHTVLAEARTVGDIIAVQDRITGVQTEIEQLQGQQRLLEDQAGFGTLSVTVGEPGSEQLSIEDEPENDGGLGGAWRDARRRFGDGVEWVVGASGTAGVLIVIAAVLGLLGRLGWQLLRRRLL